MLWNSDSWSHTSTTIKFLCFPVFCHDDFNALWRSDGIDICQSAGTGDGYSLPCKLWWGGRGCVGRCRLQSMSGTVGPMYLQVHGGGLKSASSPFYCCSILRYILLMGSEGNTTEHCELIFCAVSAVLVINDELSVSPGRAISMAFSYIAVESWAQCYFSSHL